MTRSARLAVWALVAAAILLAGYAWWQRERAEEAEANLPIEAARVLTAQFSKAPALRVATLTGEIAATSNDVALGGLLVSTQNRRLPYSVEYFIDLRSLDADAMRWDADNRTMFVRLPEVRPGPPNIDEARGSQQTASGLIVTRGAAQRLQQAISSRAAGAAARAANDPGNLAKARESGREAVERLVQVPLAAAGLSEVRVVARYPEEGRRSTERWDESTPLSEILERLDSRR